MKLKEFFKLTKTKIILLILLIILIIALLGFVIAEFFPSTNSCTMMDCSCELNPNISELPCNSCTSYDKIFVLGIINIVREDSSQEIIICENNQQVGVRYDKKNNDGKYKLRFFRID